MDITFEIFQRLLIEHEERIVNRLISELSKPKSIRIKQNEAYQLYGRANVRAWRQSGQLQAYKMLRAVEYEVAELDKLMKNKQLILKK